MTALMTEVIQSSCFYRLSALFKTWNCSAPGGCCCSQLLAELMRSVSEQWAPADICLLYRLDKYTGLDSLNSYLLLELK